jgi:glycosyltransferase involved in cell wall biosynthesis
VRERDEALFFSLFNLLQTRFRTQIFMKIHFLLTKDFFRGGGIETYTREVGRRLAERGHEVTVYSTRGTHNSVDDWEGMRFLWLPRVKPYWAEKFTGGVLGAYRALRSEAPDVYHLHSVVAGAFAPLLKLKGAPCILQMHGIEWQRARWGRPAKAVLKTLERASLSSANAITAVSQTQCAFYQANYGAECEFIPTAADVKQFAAAELIREMGLDSQQYVLFAARLVPEKGVHHLIGAYRRLSTKLPLVIAGDAPNASGYLDRLHQLAAGDARIRFIGRVQGRLLEELFSNTALFVQPSELEGLSIGLIEAMSYGIPCLASDIPENREVLGDAGLWFRNKNVADLEQQLNSALSDVAKSREFAAAGRKRAQELFSWERVVDQLEDLYRRAQSGAQPQKLQFGVPHRAGSSSTLPDSLS